jgi:hypothetical protein
MLDGQSGIPLHHPFGLRSFDKRGVPFIRMKHVQLRQQWIHGWLRGCNGSEASKNQSREQKTRLVVIHGTSAVGSRSVLSQLRH